MTTRYRIDRLGSQGDGIAHVERQPVFIPFVLPNEVVTAARIKDRAELISVIEPSPLRVPPACRHFTVCGGCALQHMDHSAYLAWKRAKVVEALKSRGIDAPVAETVACPERSRRRVVLSARRTEAGMLLGYNRALSHEIVDIAECPIAVPAIEAALPMLRQLAKLIAATPQAFHMTVTATASGLDIAAEGSGKLSEAARRTAADFIIREGGARLSTDGEIIVEPRKPQVDFGGAVVTPPPGGFLQAVAAAEDAMAGLVLAHLAKAKRVADLFAGSGAFALRLARQSEVHAVEGDAPALAALDRGFRSATGLKRVTPEKRDLFRRPLTFKELNAFDAVVFDPPRAGAEDQSKQIAKSEVPKVAAVSCNPTTLARDLEILLSGGYQLKAVTPVDQFLWSPHVEAVALLEKPKRRR
ncbi:class I SAM-dependent RNA methyltransferase [Arvimicrobium flavum]|uniref:class I SAM-dependent RNA methyltransferase n=1 Tax=Arvimicrobium flavum TaxID=3393320 RepID=UPI00237AA4B0|nr:class I SAM-dependent RNA methyltransferase [Mesorhizobium shangrilense]